MLLTLILAFGAILAACSKDDKASSGTSASPSASASATAVSATPKETPKPVTLKWIMLGPGKQKDSDKVWKEFNTRLQQFLPNTTVDFEVLTRTEYVEKFKLIMASAEPVDLIWSGYLINLAEEVNKGGLLPLDELLDKYGQELRKVIPERLFTGDANVNGKVYMVPSYQMTSGNRWGLRTPKELADQYWNAAEAQKVFYANKTNTKETFAVIEQYLAKLKEAGKIQKGVSTDTFNFVFKNGYVAIGDPLMYKIGEYKILNAFAAPESKLYYDTMADWFKKGYIRQDILSLQNPRADEGKKDGYVLWAHNYYDFTEKTESAQYGFPLTVIPFSEKYIAGYGTGTGTSIPRTSKNPERAMQLLDLLNSQKGKDLYNLLVYGLENEHYKKVKDNRIETIGYTGQAQDNTVPYGLWKWVPGNAFNAYETQADMEGYNDFIVKNVENVAINNPAGGLKIDPTPVKTENAQVAAVVKEFNLGLQRGALPNHDKVYAEFLDKLQKAGIDKIIAEYQKQMDAYLAQTGVKK